MFNLHCSRRTFLKSAIVGITLLSPKRLLSNGLRGLNHNTNNARLILFNTHTGERIDVNYKDEDNGYDHDAIKSLNWILRCHYSGEVIEMDMRVIEFLNLIDKGLGGGNEIHIISGYRSKEYNDLLIKMGRGVVNGSLHTMGKAIDFRILNIATSTLRDIAVNLRYGGVGYYGDDGFIHIDSGRFRVW